MHHWLLCTKTPGMKTGARSGKDHGGQIPGLGVAECVEWMRG